MTEELKPCPFCGDPMEWTVGDYLRHRIQTPGCPIAHNGFVDLAAWNRRAEHSPDAGKMVAEPGGDLVKQIGNAIEKAWGECQDLPPIEFCDHEKEYIARAVVALLQPRLDAADALVRALEDIKALDSHIGNRSGSHSATGAFATIAVPAIDAAKAAGLGGGE